MKPCLILSVLQQAVADGGGRVAEKSRAREQVIGSASRVLLCRAFGVRYGKKKVASFYRTVESQRFGAIAKGIAARGSIVIPVST